mmetsp:Transcript_25153/g.38417  ORF Transcript_25153/g.38417 Transcript_25153/m.38417 type:complete len:363 (-) Transcript_25153:89-1177(-)
MALSAQDHMQGFNANANALPPLVSNAQRQAPVSNYVFNNHCQQSNVNTAPNQFSFPGAYQQFLPHQPVPQALLYPAVNVNSPQLMQNSVNVNVNAVSSADARGRILAAYPEMAMMALDPTTMIHNPYSISAKPIAAPHNNSHNGAYPSNRHGQIEQPNIFNLQGTNTNLPSYQSSHAAMMEDPRNSSATGTIGTDIGMFNHNSSQGRDYSQAFATNDDGNSVQPGTSAVHMDSARLKQESRYELTNAVDSDRLFQRQDEKIESLKLFLRTAADNEQHVQDPKRMAQSNLSGLMGYNNFTDKRAGICSNDTSQRQIKMKSAEATDSIQASFTTNENLNSRHATNGVQSASDGIPEGVENFAGV